MRSKFHQPVLADEAVEFLITSRSGTYIDATAGGGGHATGIISRLDSEGFLIAVDRDREAIEETRKKLARFSSQAMVLKGEFENLKELIENTGKTSVRGVLFDIGVSSHQLDDCRRGFSYLNDGPLDLRMDDSGGVTAGHIINSYPTESLSKIFYELGEEKNSRKIAAAIVLARDKNEIIRTGQLTEIIKSVTNPRYLNKTFSRVFQALRIEVNDELNQLRKGLDAAADLLSSGGRLVVISYHSLEDRIVKWFFRAGAGKIDQTFPASNRSAEPTLKILTKKPITAGKNEQALNRRSRSAKMRVAEKI